MWAHLVMGATREPGVSWWQPPGKQSAEGEGPDHVSPLSKFFSHVVAASHAWRGQTGCHANDNQC
jgi:hypothetical protein